jgi:hypothetical protein
MIRRPGQIELNEFEIAILERMARKSPAIQPMIEKLHVLSRKFTGVGCFIEFLCKEGDPDIHERTIHLGELISIPNVPHGMGAVLFINDGGKPRLLETFTFNEPWDGVHEGFSIVPAE